MKTAHGALADHLASATTTLCRCWSVTRRDGTRFGFTDHDQLLQFAGVVFDPATGFAASELQSSLGLSVDTMEVDGALSSQRITDDDIALGLWDAAEVEIWLVNWRDASQRMILRRGILGEVARGALAYRAEIRSLAHALNQEQGRTYQRGCDTLLGSPRCGIDLSQPAFSGAGSVVTAIDDRLISVAGLGAFASGWFAHGVLTWTGGSNAGARIEIRDHVISGLDGSVGLTLWQRAALAVTVGDTFQLSAGCDRTFAMCSERFANHLNFQGFPFMPGNDAALSYARRDKLNDGGSLFR